MNTEHRNTTGTSESLKNIHFVSHLLIDFDIIPGCVLLLSFERFETCPDSWYYFVFALLHPREVFLSPILPQIWMLTPHQASVTLFL